ncbi:DUF4433 domain-containing protein [Azotobacter chroococcum]|uniref:DUF4433 domain-containing protein n=1 Tax=Azotobacter chroococcum TaxID=353 RepID=UPI0010ADC6A4|nr:DUF4433 domain-containing protein [Azotobacter chroococcum]
MSHRVVELHCIMPIENLPSVYQRGILCHDAASAVAHASVAKQEIQDRRVGKTVPNGMRLHQYANLYFCARNPMLYLRQQEHSALCVIRVNRSVLDLPGVVISDQNAASNWVRFFSYPAGLSMINFDYVFAESWADPDEQTHWRKKAAKCAEALIPNSVHPSYITGFYTCDQQAKQCVEAVIESLNWAVSVTVNSHLFFR